MYNKQVNMKKYAKVIIRSPTHSIIDINLRNPYLNTPDFDIAIRQYKRYIQDHCCIWQLIHRLSCLTHQESPRSAMYP